MVGKKRKSRSWVGVDYQDEADDLRLDRRWKRRCIAIQDSKLYYSGKDSCIKGEDVCYEAKSATELTQVNCVKLDVDVDDNDADSDYREYLDSLDFEALDDGYAGNCRNESGNVRLDVNDLDSDYEKFIALESVVDGKVDKSRSMNTGDTGADRAAEGMMVNDEENNIRVDNKDDCVDADYMNFFVLDDSVNVSVENDHSRDELVKKACNNVSSLYDIESQSKEIPESNNDKSIDDERDVDKEKFVDGSALRLSGDDSVNVSVENDLGEDEFVEDVSANHHINIGKINALYDAEPQARAFLRSDNVKPTDDKLDADFVDRSTLGPSGQCTNDKNENNSDVNALGNMESQKKKIHRSNNIESNDDGPENAAVAGGSVPTRSTDNDAHHNDDDLHYKMFLENLRVEGKSYVLEVPVGTTSKIIEYEMDDRSHDRLRAKNPKRKCHSQEAAVKTNHDCRRKIEHKILDDSYEVFLNSMKKEGREMKYEKDDGSHYRYRAENPKRKRCSQEAAVKTKHDCKRKIENKIVDHSYEIFLNSMKKEGRNMIFTPETGAKVVYDEAESSDSEVIVMDSDPFANEKRTPFVTNVDVEDSKWLESSPRDEHSWFREKVTEILRQPFDRREYDKLFREAYFKKPAFVEKDMRNGRTRHIIGQGISHSYLDQYIDLGRKVTSAGSKPKVLNLLRGFFFWLQNVAHDGVFKPWLDSSCLEVLPCGRLVDAVMISEDDKFVK
ncbi:uncharacterized protein LOC126672042 [Mercurialis annua]|uniref:uncharacterized protein LOC126672042 n=1 Tax=Mercurialis annua TaxID=3986 RepID=UPI00215F501A|nr:uncharacterized protein LOC126672042 [Mercurialis annua]